MCIMFRIIAKLAVSMTQKEIVPGGCLKLDLTSVPASSITITMIVLW